MPGLMTMIEKRAFPRRRVLKQGTITYRGGGGMDCMVRNISMSGALVDIANPIALPPFFTLLIVTDHLIRQCRAVWSHDRRVGVAFE
jgi:hypothetical protein